MEDKRGSLMFDMALKVKVNFKDMPSIEGRLENLSASGEWIVINSNQNLDVGDSVAIELPVPVQIRTIQCRGQVVNSQRHNNDNEVEIHIQNIDKQSKEAIREFCNFLMPSIKTGTVNYLIQQGEKALSEAQEARIKKPVSEEIEALINELLSLKYHDALRSFEDALEIDNENEVALEGFCFSLANAVIHYEHSGLTGLAETIKVKAMQYFSEKTLEIAKKSPRISKYLLSAIQDVLDAAR